jgi:hypothetical protein
MDEAEQAALRSILEAMQAAPDNPVTRARILVERQVPPNRRGPGWDRHWRELEAYAESPGTWPDLGPEMGPETDDEA